MSADLPKPDYAHNMRIVGHCDQGGRPDGVQIIVHRGCAYVGHMLSKGFNVIDARDARKPRAVNYLSAPPNTWNIHLQTHDDLLLVVNVKDMFAAAEFADEKAYYKGQLGRVVDCTPWNLLVVNRTTPTPSHRSRQRREANYSVRALSAE